MTVTDSPSTARPTRAGGGLGRHHLGVVVAGATLLGTSPLAVLYESWTWLAQAAVAVTVVALAAAAARALRAPVPAQLLAMTAALLLALTWQFRSGGELLLLPTGATFAHFRALLAEVPPVVATEAIPVPDHDGLLLLTMAGVGLVTIMVDVLTVSLRRPALVGLPLLAIYSIPVAVDPDRVSALPFVLAVAGYLWLIATERLERVRRFGRRFTAEGRGVPVWEPSPLAAAGRRLAVVGILLAVALPLAVPGMTNGLVDRLGGGSGEGDGPGGGPPTSVNLFAHLDGMLNHDEVVELLRFTTDDPDPFYLRVGTADQVSARGFHHRAPQGELIGDGIRPTGPARAGATGHRHRAEIEILAWEMNRLPVFAELTDVSGVDGDWRHDPDQQVVFAAGERPTGLSYGIEYTRWEFDPEALRRARPLPTDHPMSRFTDVLPQPEVSDLVAELTEEAATPYDEVLAILRHFSAANGFRYRLRTGPDTTGSAIADFLFEHRAGYCVQYAAAMTWLAREAGHPARVAIGFTRGGQRDGDTYTLTNRNLHAWTEVYFEGFGWVPFDPTPSASVAGSARPEWAPDPDAPVDRDAPDGDDRSGGAPAGSPDGRQDGPSELAPEPGGSVGGLPVEEPRTWPWWTAAVVGAVLLLLSLPALRRLGVRRGRLRRPARPVGGVPEPAARRRAHTAWDELVDTLVDFRLAVGVAETPRAVATRLVQQLRLDHADDGPVAGEAVRLLSRAEERARYAPTPPADTDLAAAVRTVRRALAARSSRWVRWRARLLPPSTLQRWRARFTRVVSRTVGVGTRIGEALGRLSPRRLLRT